ncbi:hypothetical protein HPB48_021554 [Haemaphysalis longicornis]|uniref:Uncharacterized protein n=1 Tax=Haemaphysalis longicornis TaxID=44386 RepID=A0A9J6GNB2_HAELO|nr:hypothetical protein HPB48_021554 [Haemaphysalis longicornis]
MRKRPALAGTSSSDTSSETSKKPVHLGMLSDLLKFLRIEVENLEKSIIERPGGTGKPPSRFPTHERDKKPQQFAKSHQPSAAALHGTVKGMECFLCNSKKHATKVCTEEIPLTERENACCSKAGRVLGAQCRITQRECARAY